MAAQCIWIVVKIVVLGFHWMGLSICMTCRFEQLALEYDSDDIGELDQLADDQATRGHASTDQYSKMFDAFLDEHATKDHQFEGGQQYVIHKTEGAAQSSEAQDDAFLARNALEMVGHSSPLQSNLLGNADHLLNLNHMCVKLG